MSNINWVEWFGYLASALVLISFLCSSVLRLRCISMIGSTLFGIYGFIIQSYPTGVMNIAIALINGYYLLKMVNKSEFFKILDITTGDQYLRQFLRFYNLEIEKSYPDFELETQQFDVCFNVLRDMVTASVFLGKKLKDDTLLICMDFVIPEYRDMKVGNYIYNERKDKFLELGYTNLAVRPYSAANEKYLRGIGFEEAPEEPGMLYKSLR